MAKRRKKKGKWIWIVLILFAVVAFVFWPRSNATDLMMENAVVRGSITTWYSFEGDVSAPRQQSIVASEEVTVRAVYVSEDQAVQKNDRLIRLSNGDTLKADIAGEVVALHVEVDDVVPVGGALLDILDMERLEVAIKVDEYDVPAIVVGKQALVTVNALNNTLECKVLKLDKQATQSGQTSYYTATLSLPDNKGVLPGMQVEAKLINQEAIDVLLLPMEALSFDERNEPYVQMRGADGKGLVNVPVKTGVNDGAIVEVEGLNEGDVVLYARRSALSSMQDMRMMMGRS